MSEQRFDPMTGKPINQNYAGQQPTGQQTYGGQQPYNMQQQYNNWYDPTMQKPKAGKNKGLIFALAGIGVVLLAAIILIGVYVCTTIVKSTLPDQNAETNTYAQDEEPVKLTPAPIVEEPAEEKTAKEESSKEESAEEETTVEEADTDVYDDMFDVKIGDKVYNIPCKVSEFIDDGWTFDDEQILEKSLGSDEMEYSSLYYKGSDKDFVTVAIKNFDANSQTVGDSYITEVDVYKKTSMNEDLEVKTHSGDIVLGKSTQKDIVSVLGKADNLEERSNGNSLTYYNFGYGGSAFQEVRYRMDENGVACAIFVINEEKPR